MKSYTLQDLLEARENRVELQEQLRHKFNGNVLVVRVNYPGINKDNDTSRGIIKVMEKEVEISFRNSIVHKEELSGAEGPIRIFLLEEDPISIKKVAVKLEEEHPLGRCVDIDVYNNKGESISRTSLGNERRKCFLCNDIAHICVREKRHNEKDVIEFITTSYKKYIQCEKGELKNEYDR